MEEKKTIGTEEMPAPQYMRYDLTYKITPLFMNDLKLVLGEVAYADVKPVLEYITSRNYVLTAAALNELIHTISNFPYKYVNSIMNVIQNQDLAKNYFETINQKTN